MAAVASFDTHSDLSEGERLGERIAELNAYLTVTQAHFLELLRQFDEQRYWEALGFRSCAHWLNFKCGIGFNAARDKVHVHDFHATMLHLLGLDHERLTFRHNSRDVRLTDVFGNVLHEIIA